jgi:hypothetical protein
VHRYVDDRLLPADRARDTVRRIEAIEDFRLHARVGVERNEL